MFFGPVPLPRRSRERGGDSGVGLPRHDVAEMRVVGAGRRDVTPSHDAREAFHIDGDEDVEGAGLRPRRGQRGEHTGGHQNKHASAHQRAV
jgi:hypothetical protein